jgi:hypothetical protein
MLQLRHQLGQQRGPGQGQQSRWARHAKRVVSRHAASDGASASGQGACGAVLRSPAPPPPRRPGARPARRSSSPQRCPSADANQVLQAFYIGRAFAITLNRRLGEAVVEVVSEASKVIAENPQRVQEFQAGGAAPAPPAAGRRLPAQTRPGRWRASSAPCWQALGGASG